MDIQIGFRNPIKFVKQYWTRKQRIRAMFIWMFWCWKSNMCDVWIDYGFRFIGIEVNVRRFLGYI